ncbi:hypothetical protein Hanom_Chr06g00487181 [Helianthus anomalus]
MIHTNSKKPEAPRCVNKLPHFESSRGQSSIILTESKSDVSITVIMFRMKKTTSRNSNNSSFFY